MLNERIRPDVNLGATLDVDSITSGPFANPRLKEVMRKFGKVAFGRSSACAEFEHFLQNDIGSAYQRPDASSPFPRLGARCLEIGTFHGITAVILSQFFDQVLCVSVDEMPVMKREIVSHLGIKNIAFHDAKDNVEKAAFINVATFDFCYQDGDHTNDTLTDFALVKRCGRVLFHEYWPLQPAVWNLVNSLPPDEVTRAQFDCLAYWEKK